MNDNKRKLWELQKGWTFIFDDDPETELLFLGMDGFYAKVKALDPEKHKKLCASYDAGSDFFCIMSDKPVTLKVPEAFKVEPPPTIFPRHTGTSDSTGHGQPQ
jgi:hypothetical protein